MIKGTAGGWPCSSRRIPCSSGKTSTNCSNYRVVWAGYHEQWRLGKRQWSVRTHPFPRGEDGRSIPACSASPCVHTQLPFTPVKNPLGPLLFHTIGQPPPGEGGGTLWHNLRGTGETPPLLVSGGEGEILPPHPVVLGGDQIPPAPPVPDSPSSLGGVEGCDPSILAGTVNPQGGGSEVAGILGWGLPPQPPPPLAKTCRLRLVSRRGSRSRGTRTSRARTPAATRGLEATPSYRWVSSRDSCAVMQERGGARMVFLC